MTSEAFTPAIPSMAIAPVTNLHEVRVNPGDLNDITDGFGFDWLHDYEYKASRIVSIATLESQAAEAAAPDDLPQISPFVQGILDEVRRRLNAATDSVMFVPDETIPARGAG